jgi:hypothetical protein
MSMQSRLQVCCGAFALAMASALAVAQPEHRIERPRIVRPAPPHPGYRYDLRYGHAHYYPPRGYVVGALPAGSVTVNRFHEHFFFAGGVWYAPRGPGFVAIAAPIGVFVTVLPPAYTQVWVGGVPYYYANDTYYAYNEGQRAYEVVAPPAGAEAAPAGDDEAQGDTADSGYVTTPPADAGAPPDPGPPPQSVPGVGGLFVYAAHGQSEQQQSQDKWECHQWAVGQTGFDPTAQGGNPARRPDYQRALAACLQGRGYSVR